MAGRKGYNAKTTRCNARKKSRPPEARDAPVVDPGPHAGEWYCGRPAGEKTDHKGMGRCYRHMGNTIEVGEANRMAKTLDHSKYIPARYLKDFEDGLRDPTIQREQLNELAGLHALIVEAWQRTGDGVESGETWKRVMECGSELDKLYRKIERLDRGGGDDAIKLESAMARAEILAIVESRLLPLIRHGAGEQYAKEELTALWQKRAKLIRVQQQGERTVPIEVLGVLLARTAAIASDVILSGAIEDQKVARKVLSAFVTRLRMETLPADGAGIVKRLDAQAGRGEIERKVKVITPDGGISDDGGDGINDDGDDGVIDVGRAPNQETQDPQDDDVDSARREHMKKGVMTGAILASMGIGTSASIADIVGVRIEDDGDG